MKLRRESSKKSEIKNDVWHNKFVLINLHCSYKDICNFPCFTLGKCLSFHVLFSVPRLFQLAAEWRRCRDRGRNKILYLINIFSVFIHLLLLYSFHRKESEAQRRKMKPNYVALPWWCFLSRTNGMSLNFFLFFFFIIC